MKFYFNPLDTQYKSVVGSISNSEKLKIFVKSDVGEVTFYLRRDDESEAIAYPMQKSSDGFFVCLNGLETGIYFYFFVAAGAVFGLGKNHLAESSSLVPFQLSVYADDYKTPDWIKGGIIYQIFPDRFFRVGDFEVGEGKVAEKQWAKLPTYRNADGKVLNNEFFGGNFKGITAKLDYLAELGIKCIYLNPISKAFSSHRYDTGDYLTIDSVLGSEADLQQMLEKADGLQIRFIFDGVYNHTGADSLYFNKYHHYDSVGAYNSQDSEFFEWYDFQLFPEKYSCWWDFKTLPSIKKDCASFHNFVCDSVLKKYLGNGFAGVRLDVVDELEDCFVRQIRASAKEINEDSLIVGEVWEDASNKIAYGERRSYFLGSELDSVMNYQLKNAIVDFLLSGKVENLGWTVEEQLNNFPKCALDVLMNILSTHDSVRIITELGREKVICDKDEMKDEIFSKSEYERGKKLAKLAYLLVYTLYGVPSVYYGDEAGMTGNLDPYNRKCFEWEKMDCELLDYFKRLAEIRTKSLFKDGNTKIISAEDGLFVFERENDFENIIIAVSRRQRDVYLTFSGEVKELLEGKFEGEKYLLKSDSAAVFVTKKCQ